MIDEVFANSSALSKREGGVRIFWKSAAHGASKPNNGKRAKEIQYGARGLNFFFEERNGLSGQNHGVTRPLGAGRFPRTAEYIDSAIQDYKIEVAPRARVAFMNSQITGLRVARVAFALMAIAQWARLVIRPEALVAGYAMPLWPSALAFIVLGGLSIWMWKLARRPAP